MPKPSSNPLAKFLAALETSERDLVVFALDQQVEGIPALSDGEHQDLLSNQAFGS